MSISDYSETASSNTTINGVNIDEGCSPAGLNDAIRQLMADIAAEDIPGALGDKAEVASPTFTGTATSPLLRLTATSDASLTSTGHALQIGPTDGANTRYDGNEVQAADAGVKAAYLINAGGGNVSLSAAGDTTTVKGRLVADQNSTLSGDTDVGGALTAAKYKYTHGQIGDFAMARYTGSSTTIDYGDSLSGSELEPTSAGGGVFAGSGTLSGTWVCCGAASGAGGSTSELRIALWRRTA